jgi:hypothetical protein
MIIYLACGPYIAPRILNKAGALHRLTSYYKLAESKNGAATLLEKGVIKGEIRKASPITDSEILAEVTADEIKEVLDEKS